MLLIAISGDKHSKKDLLAMELAKNSDCIWIHPYSDRKVPKNYNDDRYIYLNKEQLSDKINKEIPFAVTEVNGNRYVFFENQLRADFCVLIGDDRIVSYLKNNWKGELFTIRCTGGDYSERNLLSDSEFDAVFDYDKDDIVDLESQIEYR